MEQMEARIEDLKQRKAARDKMRYSEAFKADATAVVRRLIKDGLTKSKVSNLLDIPWVTLARWKDAEQDVGSPKSSGGFRPVNVVDERSGSEPVLVSPGGWRIEGLSVDELVALARRLS